MENEQIKQEYIQDHQTELKDDDLTMYHRPNTGCRHCYGRGYEGWEYPLGTPRLCRCVKRMPEQDNALTYFELKVILSNRLHEGVTHEPEMDTETTKASDHNASQIVS